jgi:hypothetical protein
MHDLRSRLQQTPGRGQAFIAQNKQRNRTISDETED